MGGMKAGTVAALRALVEEMLGAMAPMHVQCCEDHCCSLADMGWPEVCFEDFVKAAEALGCDTDAVMARMSPKAEQMAVAAGAVVE